MVLEDLLGGGLDGEEMDKTEGVGLKKGEGIGLGMKSKEGGVGVEGKSPVTDKSSSKGRLEFGEKEVGVRETRIEYYL